MTTRRRAALGAIGAGVLLLAATACASESNDSSAESLSDTAVETTVGNSEAPGAEAPAADAPSETTAAPNDAGSGGDESAATEPAVVVPEALQFTAPLVGGGTFDGAAEAGKPTVFWFWAPT